MARMGFEDGARAEAVFLFREVSGLSASIIPAFPIDQGSIAVEGELWKSLSFICFPYWKLFFWS